MNVLLDSRAIQTRVHLEDGLRLRAFIGELESAGASVVISNDRLDSASLDGVAVVVIPTRQAIDGNEFGLEELASLERFTANGGGLLLMSNHGDLPGHNPWDHTRHDRVLAARFGVELVPAWFSADHGTLTEFGNGIVNADHEIVGARGAFGEVRCLVTNNCSGIARGSGAPLVALPAEMVDRRNGLPAKDYVFGCALEDTPERRGRVVVLTDSGFIGTAGTTRPGPGLIDRGDNLRFAMNIVSWLGAAERS